MLSFWSGKCMSSIKSGTSANWKSRAASPTPLSLSKRFGQTIRIWFVRVIRHEQWALPPPTSYSSSLFLLLSIETSQPLVFVNVNFKSEIWQLHRWFRPLKWNNLENMANLTTGRDLHGYTWYNYLCAFTDLEELNCRKSFMLSCRTFSRQLFHISNPL